MKPIDYQDYVELINLVSAAWSEEILAGGIRMGSPTNRAVNLHQLEMKLIRAKRKEKESSISTS